MRETKARCETRYPIDFPFGPRGWTFLRPMDYFSNESPCGKKLVRVFRGPRDITKIIVRAFHRPSVEEIFHTGNKVIHVSRYRLEKENELRK